MASPFQPQLSTELELSPGTLTAVVNAGGLVNLALVMPTLLRLVDQGHKLGVVGSKNGSKSTGLAAPFDFVAARGPQSLEDLNALLNGSTVAKEMQWSEIVGDGLAKAIFNPNPRHDSEWLSDLESEEPDKESVLLVPDLQEDLALRDWSPDLSRSPVISSFDVMPAQLAGLKALSRRGDLAVVGGHCAGHECNDSWRVVADIADQTIVVKDLGEVRPGRLAVELSYYSPGSATGLPEAAEQRVVDLRFSEWRNASRLNGMAA